MIVLALEASTSAAKALLARDDTVLAQASLPYPGGDSARIDADRAVALALEAGRQALAAWDGIPDAIALASIWHGLLPLDSGYRPTGPCLTWADTGGSQALADLSPALGRDIYRLTGCPPHPSYTLYKLMARRHAPPARVATLGEYLYRSLTGRLEISLSAASGTGLLALDSLDWDSRLAQLAGVSPDALPALVPDGHWAPLAPAAARLLGLPEGIPVTPAMPDGALNQLALGLDSPALTVSVGTSGALRLLADRPAPGPDMATWCYYAFGGRYIRGAATSGAGNCVSWFLAREPAASLAGLEAALPAVDIAAAPVFLPFPFGERSPGWAGARPWGLRDADRADTAARYYAVLEGVLMNLRQGLDALAPPPGTPGLLSGGILHSAFWPSLAADVLGLPLTPSDHLHASLLGAVGVGRYALGDSSALAGRSLPAAPALRPDPARQALLTGRFGRYLEHYTKEESSL